MSDAGPIHRVDAEPRGLVEGRGPALQREAPPRLREWGGGKRRDAAGNRN